MQEKKFEKLADTFIAEGEHGALQQIMNAANEVFYHRHPELRGKHLEKSSPEDLKTEWAEIFRTQTRLAMIALGTHATIDAKLFRAGG